MKTYRAKLDQYGEWRVGTDDEILLGVFPNRSLAEAYASILNYRNG